MFQGEPAINHISSQRPNSACCCHHQLAFIKTERQQKKNGEKPSHILYFTALFLTNFSINCCFGGWTRNQLNSSYRSISPRHHYLPLTFIKTEQQCKKNGEKPFHTWDFAVLSSTIFSIRSLFLGRTCVVCFKTFLPCTFKLKILKIYI